MIPSVLSLAMLANKTSTKLRCSTIQQSLLRDFQFRAHILKSRGIYPAIGRTPDAVGS